MSLKHDTPCDFGPCPYGSESMETCIFYCASDEPQDDPDIWEDDCDYEVGYDPYLGCFTEEV